MTAMVPQDSAAATGLDSFDFHGDEASIYTDERGYWIFPGQLCRFMGIDANNQRKRTERNHWSEGWTAIVAVRLPGDDRSREHVILHQRRLPMWLGSIVTTRIKDETVRAQVEAHQTEFADALADYLTKGLAVNPRTVTVPVEPVDDLDIIDMMTSNLRIQRRQLAELQKAQAESDQRQTETAARVSALEGAHDWVAALGYAKLHDYPTDRPYLSRIGKAASRLIRAEGGEPQKRQDATFGSINVYPVHILEQAFADVPE